MPMSATRGRPAARAAARQRFLDDEFGFRTGDQHGGRDGEVEAPELAHADDVGASARGARAAQSTPTSVGSSGRRHRAALFGQQRARDPTPRIVRA